MTPIYYDIMRDFYFNDYFYFYDHRVANFVFLRKHDSNLRNTSPSMKKDCFFVFVLFLPHSLFSFLFIYYRFSLKRQIIKSNVSHLTRLLHTNKNSLRCTMKPNILSTFLISERQKKFWKCHYTDVSYFWRHVHILNFEFSGKQTFF